MVTKYFHTRLGWKYFPTVSHPLTYRFEQGSWSRCLVNRQDAAQIFADGWELTLQDTVRNSGWKECKDAVKVYHDRHSQTGTRTSRSSSATWLTTHPCIHTLTSQWQHSRDRQWLWQTRHLTLTLDQWAEKRKWVWLIINTFFFTTKQNAVEKSAAQFQISLTYFKNLHLTKIQKLFGNCTITNLHVSASINATGWHNYSSRKQKYAHFSK